MERPPGVARPRRGHSGQADGTHFLLLCRLAKTDVLILDDFGPRGAERLPAEGPAGGARGSLRHVLHDPRSPASSSPREWHSVIGDETIADAVCDRLVHNAYRVKFGGESIRKVKGDWTKAQKTAK